MCPHACVIWLPASAPPALHRRYEQGGNVSHLRELLAIGAALRLKGDVEARLAAAAYASLVAREDVSAKKE